MESDELVYFSEFEFKVLRKYMLSLYAELRFHENDPPDRKAEFLRMIVPRFYVRIRKYRNISLEMISRHSNVPVEKIQDFEIGKPVRYIDTISIHRKRDGKAQYPLEES